MDSDPSSDTDMGDGPVGIQRHRSHPSPHQDESDNSSSSSPPANPGRSKMPPKKKGTAAAAAAAKRGTKKAKAPRSKTEKAAPKPPAAGRGSDDESDNGPYCICRGPDDHRWMIGCDVCEDWFHGSCVDLEEDIGENLIERFVCPNCTSGKDYTKYKKACSMDGCKKPARLYTKSEDERSVFCSNEHCDSWWASAIASLPSKAATRKAIEVLTQEDLMGILAGATDGRGWALGSQPFGKPKDLWANGLPTKPGVLSDEEQAFLQNSAAERLALGNEIVQYKKMMQLTEWANQRRQALIEAGELSKDTCGYDSRLDTVSVRPQFAAWLETAEGQATFKAGKLGDPLGSSGDEDGTSRGVCEKKRCKPHNGWYKQLIGSVRVLVKETATAAADKLDAEDVMRQEAGIRYERRQLEDHWVQVLD